MKKLLIVALILNSSFVKAQVEKGIKFEQGLTWAQLKEKAKKENKYIFLDGFTTWCGPCKMMAKEIFPQANVGDFFNKNFINVAVQFDSTKNDNEEVKRWYKDAKLLQETYKIHSYPTYLFFNPAGELVHQVAGAANNAEEFISSAGKALDSNLQYYVLRKEYENGKKDNEFLLRLISAAQTTKDQQFLQKVINDYLSNQQNFLTRENINFILAATSKTSDPGFPILQANALQVDAIGGKARSAELVNDIIFDELVLPIVRDGGAKILHRGGMISYNGTLNKNVNWKEIKDKIDSKYPMISDRVVLASKVVYYDWAKNWSSFSEAVSNYILKYDKDLNNNKLNFYARCILSDCSDPNVINSALNWSKRILSTEPEKTGYLYTYGSLLYKSGDKESAIKVMQQAAGISGDANGEFAKTIAKMQKGENFW